MEDIVKKFKTRLKIQLNRSSGIRKMQTVAGGPLKWQRVKVGNNYGYVLVGKDNKAIDYNTDNGLFRVYSSPDISSHSFMTEFKDNTKNTSRLNSNYIYEGNPLDEVVITGTKKTPSNSSTEKTYSIFDKDNPYYSKNFDYRSVFDQNKGLEFLNIMTLGGLNNLSPTLWARRYYDLNKLVSSNFPGAKRTMTWNGFVNSWINGNSGLVSLKFEEEHPYWSTGINLTGDIIGGLGTGASLIAKKPLPFFKKSDFLKVYDNLAPKTNRIIYDPDGLYELLTPKSKYFRDRILNNAAYKEARASGQYPKTFSERRAYLEKLHNEFLDTRDRLITRRINDFATTYPTSGSDSHIFFGSYLLNNLPKNINYSSLEGHLYFIPHHAMGANYGSTGRSYVSIRQKNSLLPNQTLKEIRGTNAHELDHAIQDMDGRFRGLTTFTTELEKQEALLKFGGKYHVALNKNHEAYNDYAPIVEEFRGSWEGSPNELNSEIEGALEELKTTKSYRDLDSKDKLYIINKLNKERKWKFDFPNLTLDNLSKKGWFKLGGMLELLKNGSGIHIKKKNRGKFTEYCGGKVTDGCIRKAKASGNPTLVKRATFAANARKWKHLMGGTLISYAEEGGKTSGWLKIGNFLNSDTGKSLWNLGSQILGTIKGASKAADFSNTFDGETDALVLAMTARARAGAYKTGLEKAKLYIALKTIENPDIHYGQIDLLKLTLNFANESYDSAAIEDYKLLRAALKRQLIDAISGSTSTSGILDSIGGLASNVLNSGLFNKSKTSNVETSLLNYNTIGKSTNPYMNTNIGMNVPKLT